MEFRSACDRTDLQHHPPGRLHGLQLRDQFLALQELPLLRLQLLGRRRRGDTGRPAGQQVPLKPIDRFHEPFLLELPDAFPREHGAPGIGLFREPAGPLDQGRELFPSPDRVRSGKAEFPQDRDLAVRPPLGDGADENLVVLLQGQVRNRIPGDRLLEVDVYLLDFRARIAHLQPGQLPLFQERVIFRAAGEGDQVLDRHAGREPELAFPLHGPRDANRPPILNDLEDLEDIPGTQIDLFFPRFLEVGFEDDLPVVVHDPFDLEAPLERHRVQPPRQLDQLGHGPFPL